MFERTRQGTVHVIAGNDPLAESNIAALSTLLDDCLAVGQPHVVIDLEAVPLIDSQGLELLLDTNERCLERGGCLQLAAPNALCADILRITGVGETIGIVSDATAAVRGFAL